MGSGDQEVTMSLGLGQDAGLALVIGALVLVGCVVAVVGFSLAYRLVVNARKKVVE